MVKFPTRKVEQLTLDSFLDEFNESISESAHTKEKRIITQTNKKNRETFPIHLVIDFDQFMEFIANHSVNLTAKNEYISEKFLPEINDRMSIKTENATKHSQQEYYPYIHFFYYLALGGGLVEKAALDSNKSMLRVTDRFKSFQQLTDTEKYFFLLETFWVDLNWGRLENKNSTTIHQILPEVFTKLMNEKGKNCIHFHDKNILSRLMFDWNYFFLYFDWLGLWVSNKDQETIENYGMKSRYFAKSIILTNFGKKMIPIFMQERNVEKWNISLRRQNGEVNPMPGSAMPAIYNKEDKKDQSSEPFYQAFEQLFDQRELYKTLPRLNRKFASGVHTFKVALNGSIYRKVVLSANHTMQDLHHVLNRAYGFDNDHLYSFFMDNKKWSKDAIVSPDDNSGHATADEVSIGSVGMHIGQRFLYLFDYGDEWLFHVMVENILEGEHGPIEPYITEKKGDSPEQYPW